MTTQSLLSAQNLSKSFGTENVLHDVSLEIGAGQAVAVMGPSGSGKSTLLNCLAGVLVPDSGAVIYNGRDITTINDTQRSRIRLHDFGFVFQDGQLIPELSNRENVAMPLQLRGQSRRAAHARADELLEMLGMAGHGAKLPGDVSGGQAQRVAVARAIAGEPKIIFADEPTGALDQATGHEVMQLLTALVQRSGATLVIVTHDSNVAQWCDRLIEIRDGRVHADRAIDGSRTRTATAAATSQAAGRAWEEGQR
ncbi:ABC transporter ATP-binding protein YtrE [Corynebacterium ciconiae DSM 44920]|uniref:ABC transporter ATP-binding protein n=1 Tax=Corynebacterium ciconiae TaxID=227319 RepID=UPI000362677B|nr:ABC transporter ATP-binding protein [Corynebacterium ciconiae]WKD61603.1 ABC transporter ATP-binding protein YtrE [Corynebacterium ciconiae DSM 44920]